MKRFFYLMWMLAAVACARADEMPFDFEVLQFRAKALAARPYAPRAADVPAAVRALSYDQYRTIRFRDERAWWRREGLPFQLEFFPAGFIHQKQVGVWQVERGAATPIGFDPAMFECGRQSGLDVLPAGTGFAGLRVLCALNAADRLDELVAFQGASYFRALGKNLRYGLSARGLALNTTELGREEFPDFVEFWAERPAPAASEITLYALLDSPSAAGAYRFIVRPGAATVMQVKAAVYARAGAEIKAFGVAPLTSMFWHGENSPAAVGDMRPEVHDSDGLLIERGGGEWLWRPLVNPAQPRVATFADENPRGFGLVQRDRQFESYQDLEACYQLRPSAWVEPVGAWGRGAVKLLELPAPDETGDNIVAFWQPEQPPPAGEAVKFEYKLHWFQEGAGGRQSPAGRTVATRIGHSKTQEPELTRFWVDFDGAYLSRQPADPAIEAVVSVGDGATLANQTLQKNPFNGTWRAAFAIRPDGSGRPVELRCYLRKTPHALTETWSYQWNP